MLLPSDWKLHCLKVRLAQSPLHIHHTSYIIHHTSYITHTYTQHTHTHHTRFQHFLCNISSYSYTLQCELRTFADSIGLGFSAHKHTHTHTHTSNTHTHIYIYLYIHTHTHTHTHTHNTRTYINVMSLRFFSVLICFLDNEFDWFKSAFSWFAVSSVTDFAYF